MASQTTQQSVPPHTLQKEPSTVTHKNSLAVVQKMYECFNRGDMETIKKEVFAPDIVWNLPGRHPLAGTKHGADEVLAFFGQLGKVGIRVDLIGLDQFHEDTVVEVHHGYSQAPINGAKLDAYNCTHYQVVNNKIQNVQVYLSDQYGADNFFWAAFELKGIPGRLSE
ncbi:MAG TPA: nuclear transport factor 2 family protein [Ktedonosporobacter sp.]|nr:nuclear transport factor 2 family protein [Ktedonosporobacter sp.]